MVGSDWQTVTRGFFADFENREVKWYPGEKAELKAVFRGPELPFQVIAPPKPIVPRSQGRHGANSESELNTSCLQSGCIVCY